VAGRWPAGHGFNSGGRACCSPGWPSSYWPHLVTQPLAVGLVAVIRKILFVLSSEEPVSTAELALLIAMIAVFVAALILVSRYDRTDAGR
jgi:hypothetical protein